MPFTSGFDLCPACGRQAACACDSCGELVVCADCTDSELADSHRAVCKLQNEKRCDICHDTPVTLGVDPGCHVCNLTLCLECNGRLETRECPVCRAEWNKSSFERVESLLEPQSDGTIRGLHQAIRIILADWISSHGPQIGQKIEKLVAWQNVSMEMPLLDACINLCKGSDFAPPFPFGLAQLTRIVSDDSVAKTLRQYAIRLDVDPPYAASQVLISKVSLATRRILLTRLFWVDPFSAKNLAKSSRDLSVCIARYAVAARAGLSIASDAIVDHIAGVTVDCIDTQKTLAEAAEEYGSSHADLLLARMATSDGERIRLLSRALDRGNPKAAYPLAQAFEKMGEAGPAASSYMAALTECYAPRDPDDPEPISRAADIHFKLARLQPFAMGCAEVHLRAAANRGHADAALLCARIAARGSRSSIDTHTIQTKMLNYR